jgi:hypothetical protein
MWPSRYSTIHLPAPVSRYGSSHVVGAAFEERWLPDSAEASPVCNPSAALARPAAPSPGTAAADGESTLRRAPLRTKAAVEQPSHEPFAPLRRSRCGEATADVITRPPEREGCTRATCRDCLPRLRYAFRLSQPLDVLFLSIPSGLVACRWRPWGSAFGGFPCWVAGSAFTERSPGSSGPSLCRFAAGPPGHPKMSAAAVEFRFRDLRIPPVRDRGRCYPDVRDSCLP